MDLCANALQQRQLPFSVRKKTGDFNPAADTIQIMTMKVSKGLEFPVVATRATQRLPITVSRESGFGARLRLVLQKHSAEIC